jgi:dihydropteroate synthase
MTAQLRLRDRTVTIEPGRPLVMGIVNANPDSFSDDVRTDTLEDQVQRALTLVAEGADLVDVGGESGVTYNAATPAELEIARVVPLVERLVAEGVLVSVDTWKAVVARAAVEAGAAMLNDVSGLHDPAIAAAAASSGAALVVMHTRAAPKEVAFPSYGGDVVGDVEAFLRERVAQARAQGVADEQIVLDPGPDFAKTPAQTVAVLRALEELRELGPPLLLAVSNKDFVGAVTGRGARDRLAGTLAAVSFGVDAGASVLRVHDVAAAADFLRMRAVLRGEIELAPDDGLTRDRYPA